MSSFKTKMHPSRRRRSTISQIMRARCDSLHDLEVCRIAVCKWFPEKQAGLLTSHLASLESVFSKKELMLFADALPFHGGVERYYGRNSMARDAVATIFPQQGYYGATSRGILHADDVA